MHLLVSESRFGVFPIGESEVLFCQTLIKDFETLADSMWISTKYVGSKTMEEKEHRLFVFFHHEGQFLVPGSMNSVQLRDSREVKQIALQISGTEMINDKTLVCNPAKDIYDTCLHNYWMENLDNCTLPFYDANITSTRTCSTFEDGSKAMQMISNMEEHCLPPCVQFEANIVENPVLFTVSKNISRYLQENYQLLIGAHFGFKDEVFNQGYFINLPKYIPYRKSSQNYDAISYVAEFAGWAGLFLGLSLSGCLLVILRYLQSLKPFNQLLRMCIKGIMFLVYILCLAYLTYLTVTLVSKLMENRLATSISLEKSKVDFDLTVCTTQIIREKVKIIRDGANTWEFRPFIRESYTNWNNLTSMVSKVTIFTGEGEENIEPKLLEASSKVNLPLTIGTMDFCHTIDLSSFNEIEKINLYVTSEVKIFLHYSGQFLYSWYNWKNVFTSVTKDSYSREGSYGYNLNGLDIILKLEKIAFSIEDPKNNFDECFLNNVLVNEELNDDYKNIIKSSKVDNFSGKETQKNI